MKRIRRTPRGNRCDKSLDSQGILLFVLKRGKIAISRQPLSRFLPGYCASLFKMANTGSYFYGINFPYRMHRKPSDRPAYIRKIRKLAADIVVWYAQEAAVFMPSRNDTEIGAPSIYFSFILAGCCHPERVDAGCP